MTIYEVISNYDFIITITQVTLRTHIHDFMDNIDSHKESLATLKQTIQTLWSPVDSMFNTDIALSAFLSGITI